MSLRARLLIGMVVVAAVLGVAAAVITHTIEDHLLRQVDAMVRGGERRGIGLGFDLGRRPGFVERPSPLYVAVVQPDGRLTPLFTPTLGSVDTLPAPTIDGMGALAAATTGELFTVGSQGSSVRYRVGAFVDERAGTTVVLALPLSDLDRTVDRLVIAELLATGAVLVVLGLVTWWVIRLGVRPVKRMTAFATTIAAGNLSGRVPEAAPGTEAAELGDALNQMLGRIEEAFARRSESEDRLRRFVSDASHELRTPVTTIRGYAELHQSGGLDDPEELAEAMRRTEQEAIRMGVLVDDLLHLARLDQGRDLELMPVDLGPMVEDAARDARAVEPDRPVTVSVASDGPVMVLGDDGRLRQVVGNLVGNALVHTEPGTPVELRVLRRNGSVVLEVADEGPGMTKDVAARAFERFYRADPSRSRHRGGSGLGLAIVEATVVAHGGRVTLETAPGAGTTVRVDLPGPGGEPELPAGGSARTTGS